MLLLTPVGLHYTRCPLSCPVRVRVWLWVWAWTCVALSAAQGIGAGQGTILQDFPIAAEENFYSFNPDGTYTFSYDTGGGEHQSFRIEMRDASGRVSGRFGYVDPAGALRITEYQADSSGYRASIEVYHQVSLAPPTPLIVGPLPKEPTTLPDPPADPPQPPVMHPVGPAPFFPPQQPVLIIGPLPKPLQPESAEDDQDPPDLNEDSLFTVSSNPLIPAVFPKTPLGDASPGDLLNTAQGTEGISILQGNFTDIPQQSSSDPEISPNSTVIDILQVSYDGNLEVSRNSTVTASRTPTENTNQHRESLDVAVWDAGQTGASSNSQHFPQKPQLLLTQNGSPVTLQEHKDINPTMTNHERKVAITVPGVTVHAKQGNPVSDSDVNSYTNSDLLQPSPTSTIISTVSRLAERGAKSESATAATSSPMFMTKRNDDPRSQSRRFRNLPPVPPTPSQTYLPVGAPRHQYPTAPLLQLPQDSNSYPT
uniref:Uncharacterized protein n=2 Tax=Scylla olivacea TaxID=85551 RepID=A0A0N7ZAK7_SCYOL